MLCCRKIPLAEKSLDKRWGKNEEFSVGNLLSHSSKLLVVEFFDVSSISVVMSQPFVELFLSRSTGRFRKGTILCCGSETFR